MNEQPGYPPQRILRGMSLPRRIGYVVAGLCGLLGAAMLAMLWATEPVRLPARTQLAFAGLILVGAAWAAFAAWALARRPLFAVDRLIAAALAVGFSTLTMVGAVAVAIVRSSTAGAFAATGTGLALIVTSTIMLVRARAYRALLLARERELREPPVPSNPNADNDNEDTAAMTTRKSLPIGPLALALRHRRSGSTNRRIAIAAVILGLALVAGVALLLR